LVDDVARFYSLYDRNKGALSEELLQSEYLDAGSAGLHRFADSRHITGKRIASAIRTSPQLYSDAKRCVEDLPGVQTRLRTALPKLAALYPEAKLPPITLVVGPGKPIGMSDETGVMIGVEALCAVRYFDKNIEDRYVHVIAHEYAHVQQAVNTPALYNTEHPTVLEQSLLEGSAEFTAQMITGGMTYNDFDERTSKQEKEIEQRFYADKDMHELSNWLYNGTLTTAGDLGYWVGYRIVKSYYQRASNKREAFRDIIEMKQPERLFAESGWYPGIKL
jgi:hypothetical protein